MEIAVALFVTAGVLVFWALIPGLALSLVARENGRSSHYFWIAFFFGWLGLFAGLLVLIAMPSLIEDDDSDEFREAA